MHSQHYIRFTNLFILFSLFVIPFAKSYGITPLENCANQCAKSHCGATSAVWTKGYNKYGNIDLNTNRATAAKLPACYTVERDKGFQLKK